MDLPVTVTEVKQAHTDNEQAALYEKLRLLDVALSELKGAGMMGKAAAAEVVVNEMRDTLGLVVNAINALMNEGERIRADLEHMKKHGFGG